MGATCRMEISPTLGKYTLLEKLAEGYLGPVYRAFASHMDQAVAIRIVCAGIRWDTNVEARFYREFQPVAALRHPNIAAIFEVGKEGQSPYIVTELLGGDDLRTLIERKPAIPWEEKLIIMIMVAEGLSHAHKNGVLHRNLKPGKIHLAADGSAKIRDFNLAHILMRHLPYPSIGWGTPVYSPPEQIQHRKYDERSDIFSVGIIFHELLTYLHPFHPPDGNKASDNIHCSMELPTFDQFPDAPPKIWHILRRCLANDPEDRYGSMAELSSACKELLRDLTDETQHLSAELPATSARLETGTVQTCGIESSAGLLRPVETRPGSEEDSDYEFLNRLITAQVERPPVIQAAAGAPPALEPLREQPVTPAAASAKDSLPLSNRAGGRVDVSPPVQPAAKILIPGFSGQPSDGPKEAASAEQAPSNEGAVPEIRAVDRAIKGFDGDGGSRDEPQRSAAIPFAAQEPADTGASSSSAGTTPLLRAVEKSPPTRMGSPVASNAAPAYRYRRIPKPAYRSAAMLMSILMIVVAVYVIRASGTAAVLPTQWLARLPDFPLPLRAPTRQSSPKPAAPEGAGSQKETDQVAIRILMKEAKTLVAGHRFEEARVFIRRILEINPTHEAALAILDKINPNQPSGDGKSEVDGTLRKKLDRVSALISSGTLQAAKAEMDNLQRTHPGSPEVLALRKRLEARDSKMAAELARKEEEQKKAARSRKEEEWNRRLDDLFTQGKYNEAGSALSLWLADDPTSSRAQQLRIKVAELQQSLKAYETAMAESRYQDALKALDSAEQANPADAHLVALRRGVEGKKAAARASLTVYRLGNKANLLLDGKPIGKDGEIESESIPVGSHTIAIENETGLIVSTSQEFSDNRKVVYVHDSAKRQLRLMVEADRELLAQRRAMEEVHRTAVEHDHGWLRGICKGALLVDYMEVIYKPASGLHGFRLPFKRLKLKVRGKSLDFFYASDDKEFQSFRVQDAQAAENFKLTWDKLAAIGQ